MTNPIYNKSLEFKTIGGDVQMSRVLQEILLRHWLFGVLPGRAIADLANQFTVKKYSANQYIFHQDDTAERLYVILEGEIAIESHSIDGKVTNIAQLREGEIFGEFALIDSAGRSASARVRKKANLASLSASIFEDILSKNPDFTRTLLKVVVSRLRQTNEQVESLVTLSVLQRTARLLLLISEVEGETLKITQKEIGERLFASREKVNVKLKELEQLGAIETGHGRIKILDRPLLGKIMDNDGN